MNNRASWDEPTTKILLELCIEQKNQLNWSDRCLTKLGWRNVHSRFRAATGLQLGTKQLQNKLNNLRRQFFGWRALETSTGLGRDTQTGGVSADATYWEQDQQDTQGRSQPHSVKPPPFMDLLFELYGHEPQDRGTLLSAGGIREGTPSMGTEGNFVDLEDDPAPATSARVSARAKSKRPVREYSVDSPTKKRSDNLEQYIRNLSESVAKRSLLRQPSAHEQLNRCLEILKEDGIEQGSELHNQAMFSCGQSSECRTTFIGLDTKDAQLSWINFYWNMMHKK
ncbi:uncharacterized protein [Setaria viridis]|uniref:Myb/SANT-like domain-containing protein n=1 Tax=Setaria viridis TaxID=4556 RepID=A0A4U6VEH9_SETVI|nr:uncharacterized protein LOC117850774 [Setaria viridis]TKW27122.1 hypothetical protein SEVIR_3G237550v2 [Setaria viridis]